MSAQRLPEIKRRHESMVKLVLKNGSFEAGINQTQEGGMVRALLEGINQVTVQNFTVKKNEDGELVFVADSVPNCGDWKRTLFALPNNTFNLIDPASGHTNSRVHQTLRTMSIDTKSRTKLVSAKRVDRKVIYWNPVEARKLITASKNKEAKQLLEAKYQAFQQLEDAYPL